MKGTIGISAAGKIFTLIFLAADIALGVWIFRSYRQQNIVFDDDYDYEDYDDYYDDDGGDHGGGSSGSISGIGRSDSSTAAEKETAAPEPAETVKVSEFSTDERPVNSDFTGWYVQDVYSNGIPSDAVIITDFDDILGSWKGMIYADIKGEYGKRVVQMTNMIITGTGKKTSLTVDWYVRHDIDGEKTENEEDKKDTEYTGSWDGGKLTVSGSGTIRFDTFYEYNGKQYAVGEVDSLFGVPAVAAMVRP